MSKMNWGRGKKASASTKKEEDKKVDASVTFTEEKSAQAKEKKAKKEKKPKKSRIEFLAERYIGRKISIPKEGDDDYDKKKLVLFDDEIRKDKFLEIVDLDPSQNKQYAEWILNIYAKGKFLMEDIGRMHEYLLLFDKCKHRLDEKNRNIKNYKNIEELYEVLIPYRNLSEEELMSNTQLLKIKKLEGAECLYEDERWKVIVPLTQEAAILYGANTNWCTASKHGHSNYFKTYTQDKKPGSRLYIIVDKTVDPRQDPRNHKFQFHWETNQFQNAQNSSVGKVDNWLAERPVLLDVFTKLDTPFGINLRFKYNKNLSPEDKVINGDLIMAELEMVNIPSGLVVKGNCDFRGCQATTIDSLYVEGELNLEGSEIKTITGELFVGKSIKGKNCKLESLPVNTRVKGSVTLMSSQLKVIPKGLEVGSNLYLSNTNVKRIEPDISVGNHLYLHGVKLENPDEKIKYLGGTLKNEDIGIGMKTLIRS